MTRRTPSILIRNVAALAVLVWIISFSAAGAQPGETPGGETLPDLIARAERAGVDSNDLSSMVARGREAGLEDRQVLRLTGLIVELAEEDLPYRPVMDRARQGLAKRVAPERIGRVCTRMVERLRQGAVLVDGAFGAAWTPASGRASRVPARLELIDHTSFALEKGVPPAAIERMFNELGGSVRTPAEVRSMQAPVVAMTGLAAKGVSPDDSFRFVAAAFQQGVRDRDLKELSLAVAHAGGNRDMMQRVVQGLRDGRRPSDILHEIREHIARERRRRMRDSRGHDRDNQPPDDPGRRRRGGGRP